MCVQEWCWWPASGNQSLLFIHQDPVIIETASSTELSVFTLDVTLLFSSKGLRVCVCFNWFMLSVKLQCDLVIVSSCRSLCPSLAFLTYHTEDDIFLQGDLFAWFMSWPRTVFLKLSTPHVTSDNIMTNVKIHSCRFIQLQTVYSRRDVYS